MTLLLRQFGETVVDASNGHHRDVLDELVK
jgi:hypothetical protein